MCEQAGPREDRAKVGANRARRFVGRRRVLAFVDGREFENSGAGLNTVRLRRFSQSSASRWRSREWFKKRPNLTVLGQVYQLRIQLSGISPPIWRRILVAADCTIAELHQTIQLAMGWTDEHLHRFTIRGQWFCVPREGGVNFRRIGANLFSA